MCGDFLGNGPMIKLIVINPIVLEKLRGAYPTPPMAAEKALNKYLDEAANLINDAIERGQPPYDKKWLCCIN